MSETSPVFYLRIKIRSKTSFVWAYKKFDSTYIYNTCSQYSLKNSFLLESFTCTRKKIVFASQRVLYQYFNACKYVVKNIKSKWTKSKKTRWYLLKCIQSFNVLKCNLFKVYHMVILYFYNKKVLMMAL